MDLQEHQRLHVHRKTSLTRHRYRVFLDNGSGRPGGLVAFLDSDKAAVKDRGIIYSGEDKSQVLAEFRARKLIDASAAFDVVAPDGDRTGSCRRDVTRSLYRSAWTLEQEGEPSVTVVERNMALAIARRAWTLLPTVGTSPSP